MKSCTLFLSRRKENGELVALDLDCKVLNQIGSEQDKLDLLLAMEMAANQDMSLRLHIMKVVPDELSPPGP